MFFVLEDLGEGINGEGKGEVESSLFEVDGKDHCNDSPFDLALNHPADSCQHEAMHYLVELKVTVVDEKSLRQQKNKSGFPHC